MAKLTDKSGKYVYKPKTGSKSARNYDPKNKSQAGGGGGPKIAKMYSPPKGAQQGKKGKK